MEITLFYVCTFICFITYNLFGKNFALQQQIDSCVQCNSSIEPKCATNPYIFLSKNCSETKVECYVRIQDGHTIRGCSSELDENTYNNCHNEVECLKCSSYNGCNSQKFPLHRTSCLQCFGDSTSSLCATNVYDRTLYQLCPIYKFGDNCYIRKDNKNRTDSFQRGCLSSALAKGLCKNKDDCFICEGNDCNTLLGNALEIPLAHDATIKLTTFSSYTNLVLNLCIYIVFNRL